jgi:hypothetical protein
MSKDKPMRPHVALPSDENPNELSVEWIAPDHRFCLWVDEKETGWFYVEKDIENGEQSYGPIPDQLIDFIGRKQNAVLSLELEAAKKEIIELNAKHKAFVDEVDEKTKRIESKIDAIMSRIG